MTHFRAERYLAALLLLAVAYFATGQIGFVLSDDAGAVSSVWIPSGIAIAALTLWGPRLWPAIVVGGFVANLAAPISPLAAVAVGCGNGLAAYVGASVLRSKRSFNPRLETVASLLLLLLVGAAAALLTAWIGGAAYAIDGAGSFGHTWPLWWVGDLLGGLLGATILFTCRPPLSWLTRHWAERVLAVSAVALSIAAVFFVGSADEWMLLPALVWLGLRFEVPVAAVTMTAVSIASAALTDAGHGPFQGPGNPILDSQAFAATATFTVLIMAALTAQRARADRQRREAERARRGLAEAQDLAGLGTWEWAPPHGGVICSPDLAGLLGLDAASGEQFLERVLSIAHPDDTRMLRAAAERLVAGASTTFECRVRAPGEIAYRWLQVAARADLAPDGSLLRVFGTAQDTTRVANAVADEQAMFWHSFEDAPVGVAIVGVEEGNAGTILRANRGLATMLGRPRDELVGLHFAELTHEDDVEADKALFAGLLQGDSESYILDKRYVRPDGGIVDAVLRFSAVRGADGSPLYGIGHVQDISHLRAAEEQLRRSEQSFRAAFETSLDPIMVVDDARRYVMANEAACQLLGVSLEELLTMTADDFMVEDDDPDAAWAQFQDDGTIHEFGRRLRRGDGQVIQVEGSGRANFLPGRHIAVMRDVTARIAAERALRHSEERYRSLVESTRDGVCDVDENYCTTFMSARFEEILGVTRGAYLGLPVSSFVHPDDRERFEAEWSQRRNGVAGAYEIRYCRPDDQAEIWASVISTPRYDDAGCFVGASAMINDITAAKDAADSSAEIAAIVGSSDDAIVSAGVDGVVKSWNPAAERFYGFSAREALGRPVSELVGQPESEIELAALHARVAAGETVRDLRRLRIGQDGEELQLSLTLTPVRGADGHVAGIARITRDVTARIEAEQQRTVSERQFRQLVETANEGVWLVDPGGVTRFANARMGAMLGYTPEEMVGRKLTDFAADPDLAIEQFREHVAGSTEATETVLRRRDGADVDVHLSTAPQRDHDDNLTGMLAMVVDMTERLAADRAAASLQQQLHQVQKLETVGQLAGGIAHDFNNLLGVILNYADFAIQTLADHPVADDLAEIKRAAERAAELTQQLLVFSRHDMVVSEHVDVNDLLAGVERLIRRTVGENVKLELHPGRRCPAVMADRSQLEQVLLNLAVNARDAMPDGGELVITTRRVEDARGHWLRLTVSDDGMGMTEDVRDRALEPFFTTKPKGSGTGLGLATAYGIVTGAGGRIDIASTAGAGTTITIELPAAVKEDSGSSGEIAVIPPGPGVVVVVEDEPAMLRLASRILTREGFYVLEAANGAEAMQLLASWDGRLDLVLTDVVMPEMSGVVLAQKVETFRPGTHVMYMSGYADRPNRLPDGASLLAKPFTAEVLVEHVRDAIGEIA